MQKQKKNQYEMKTSDNNDNNADKNNDPSQNDASRSGNYPAFEQNDTSHDDSPALCISGQTSNTWLGKTWLSLTQWANSSKNVTIDCASENFSKTTSKSSRKYKKEDLPLIESSHDIYDEQIPEPVQMTKRSFFGALSFSTFNSAMFINLFVILLLFAATAVGAFAVDMQVSPADASSYNSTSVPLQITADSTLDNISAIFDGATSTTLCESCSTYNGLYPYTWNGGHTFSIIGSLGNDSQTITSTFSITVAAMNDTNTSDSNTTQTNDTSNNTTNTTTQAATPFSIMITSPQEMHSYNSTTLPVQIDANTTLDNITAIFDGANATLLCENCATYSGLYPYTWQGGHNFIVTGMLDGVSQTTNRSFSFDNIPPVVPSNPTFTIAINSPLEQQSFNTTNVPVQIDSNATLDNISALFDFALPYNLSDVPQTLLCENCSSYNLSYPNTWEGGHTLYVIGMRNGETVVEGRNFSISTVPQTNDSNASNSSNNTDFSLIVSTPVEGYSYNDTNQSVQIDANTTLDNITAVFDGANVTLLCENCATYNTSYPYTWQGGHMLTIVGMLNGAVQTVNRTFSFDANATAPIVNSGTSFSLVISEPQEMHSYNDTNLSIQIDVNTTVDNLSASFDGANATLLCENCATYSAQYPNTWQGGHTFIVTGMLNGMMQTANRTFSFDSTAIGTNDSGNQTSNQTGNQNATQNSTTFSLIVSSPANMAAYTTTAIPVQIDSNATLDNISASFDGANATLLCENCSTYGGMYPNTWNGGHMFVITGMLNGITQMTNYTFDINVPANNGGSGSGSNGGNGGGSNGNGSQTGGQTNITTNTTTNSTLYGIMSPQNTVYTGQPQVRITTADLSDIYASFDGSPQVLLCSGSTSASLAYPFSWQGGHTMTTTTVSANGTQVLSRFFAITYPNETDPTLNTDWTHFLDNISVVCAAGPSDFGLRIVSPVNTVYTSAPQVLITTSVPRNIFVSFDNSTQLLLCSDSTSASLSLAFPWQGGHWITATATNENSTLELSRFFAITYPNETDPTLHTDWTHVLDNVSVICDNNVSTMINASDQSANDTSNGGTTNNGGNNGGSGGGNGGGSGDGGSGGHPNSGAQNFSIAINSPQNGFNYVDSNQVMSIVANETLDNMSISADGADYALACQNCSTYSITFPNTWQGGHTLSVIGSLNGIQRMMMSNFSITTPQSNGANQSNASNQNDEFMLSIDSPQATVYNTSDVQVAFSANAMLDSLSVSEDGSAFQVVCTDCSTDSFSYPNTWDGGHTLLVKGILGSVEHDATVTFAIATQSNASGNGSNTTFSAQNVNSGNGSTWYGQLGSFIQNLVSMLFSNATTNGSTTNSAAQGA